MRATLTAALLLLAVPIAGARAADVERIASGLRGYVPVELSEDGSALAYASKRGIVLRRMRADGRFGRPVLVATRAQGGREDWTLRVAARGPRAVVSWTRDDRSQIEDPDARDEGCCDRLHAVVVRAGRRPGRPRRLSPPGRSVNIGPVAVGPRSEVVGWAAEFGDWKVRMHTRRGWRPARTVSRGYPADLRFLGSRLLSLAVEEVGEAIRIVKRRLDSSGTPASGRRVASFRGIFDGAALRLDGRGETTGVVDLWPYPRNRDRLIAGGRARALELFRDETVRSSTAASGASALVSLRGKRTSTARIKVRPPGGGAFGPWQRIRIAHRAVRPGYGALLVRDDGRVHLVSTYTAGGRNVLSVTDVPGGFRRVRTYRRANLEEAGFDRLGRLIVLIRNRGRLEVVRP